MDLESFAFGGGSRSSSVEATIAYCPSCQEECIPEFTCSRAERSPTCPTCGGPTAAGPARNLQTGGTGTGMTRNTGDSPNAFVGNLDADVDPSTTGATPSNTATAAPPRTIASGGPQAIQERRAAVRDRVAQEVLAFIAAIERGEVPTAVGLPLPPGVNFLDGLQGQHGLASGGSSAPASQDALKKLRRFQVEENSWVLHQTTLRLSRASRLSIDALFAPFSLPPMERVTAPLVMADPPTAHDNLVNELKIRDSIMVVDRGVCTFASKALRAEAAGAVAVVVVQSCDVWPYVMEDKAREAKVGDGLGIPVCMVSKEDGQLIKDALKNVEGRDCVHAELSVSSSDKDCIVCQELFAVGNTVVRLPCGHLYHEGCLLKWLNMSNTCPYCRRELPTSNEDAERERRRREETETGDEAWRQFFN